MPTCAGSLFRDMLAQGFVVAENFSPMRMNSNFWRLFGLLDWPEHKTVLYQPPAPSTSFVGDTEFCGDDLHFQYYRDDVRYQAGIRFGGVVATRTRAERACKIQHIEGTYDTLVRVEGSKWVEEIRADTEPVWRDRWKMNHYMIYLDGGCFEVIADSWEPIPEEPF